MGDKEDIQITIPDNTEVKVSFGKNIEFEVDKTFIMLCLILLQLFVLTYVVYTK